MAAQSPLDVAYDVPPHLIQSRQYDSVKPEVMEVENISDRPGRTQRANSVLSGMSAEDMKEAIAAAETLKSLQQGKACSLPVPA